MENGFISSLFEVEMYEMCPKVVIWPFSPIFRPSDPQKGPLHYQESTFNDSYSLKSRNKLVLPENGFISTFLESKIIR